MSVLLRFERDASIQASHAPEAVEPATGSGPSYIHGIDVIVSSSCPSAKRKCFNSEMRR
jgi:hypothetical protein